MATRVGNLYTGVANNYSAAHGKFHGRHGAWHQLTSLLRDEVSPGFILVGPTAETTIGKNTPFVFTLTDADVNSPLKTYQVSVRYNTLGKTELVYRSPVGEEEVDFEDDYLDNSFRSTIPFGFLFSVARNSGWIDEDVSLLVTATDLLGNVMTPALVSWTVSNPAPSKTLLVIETI